ncbi:hypothetical protein EJB05_25335, partial [Eragrostis curvula]
MLPFVLEFLIDVACDQKKRRDQEEAERFALLCSVLARKEGSWQERSSKKKKVFEMASSSGSGTSSGSLSAATAALAAAAGTEEELRALMDQRRAKRMLSNRESARRSRMRKQRHLDDLTAQEAQLRRENAHVATALGLTTQGLLAVDAENAVLRTQAAELAARLQSLNDIIACMNTNAAAAAGAVAAVSLASAADPFLAFDGGATGFDDLLRSCPEMFPLC